MKEKTSGLIIIGAGFHEAVNAAIFMAGCKLPDLAVECINLANEADEKYYREIKEKELANAPEIVMPIFAPPKLPEITTCFEPPKKRRYNKKKYYGKRR